MKNPLYVIRYCVYLSKSRPRSGDYLRVGDIDLGEHRDLVWAEYERARKEHPENPAYHMRPMWYTGSPYGAEILELARQVRGPLIEG